jgi:orotidine-5'-phosphate decarboxylase
MTQTPIVFCALDTSDLDTAMQLAQTIGPITGGLKLGMEFMNNFGPHGIQAVQKIAPDAALFIDLKYHDIPNTVAGAVRAISHRFKPAFLNVHASGGLEMMRAAREACHPDSKLLAVTVLTSMQDEDLEKIGQKTPAGEQVKRLAALAAEAGLNGIVCSAHEIDLLRHDYADDFVLMVPGIRPADASHDDQKRVTTPKAALEKGATHLVIGRPITQAPDPAAAAQAIMDGLRS